MTFKKFITEKAQLLSTIGIGVLIVIAIVLAIAIYKQGNFGRMANFYLQNNGNKPTTVPKNSTQPQVQGGKVRRAYPTNLTDDEKKLFDIPSKDDTSQKKNAHFVLAQKMAVEADVLEINKCEKPAPLDMKLQNGQMFKVHNNDSVKHTLIIDAKHTFVIPPNSTSEFKTDFGHGLGIYGYLCDDLAGVVGFWYLTK